MTHSKKNETSPFSNQLDVPQPSVDWLRSYFPCSHVRFQANCDNQVDLVGHLKFIVCLKLCLYRINQFQGEIYGQIPTSLPF